MMQKIWQWIRGLFARPQNGGTGVGRGESEPGTTNPSVDDEENYPRRS